MRLSRRFFLTGACASLAAAACGRGGAPRATPEAAARLDLVTSSIEHVVGDRRLAFAVFEGARPIGGTEGAGKVRLQDAGGRTFGPVDVRAFSVSRSSGGDAPAEGTPSMIFVAEVPFESPSDYVVTADVTIDGRRLQAAGEVGVAGDSATLSVGDKAIEAPSPTVRDARGVSPICTRTPPCGMHEISLDAALRTGRPVVVSFATPALCTSRLCGPVIDEIEAARPRGEGVEFVHVEIYTNTSAADTTEAVKAWRIGDVGEPFTFFVARDSTVRERMSGAVATFEVEAALERLRA